MVRLSASRFSSPLTLTLLASTAIAIPSRLLRRDLTQQSTCFDLESYQSANSGQLTPDMWGLTDASGYLSDWWGYHYLDSNFAADFAQPWGMGQSFSCRFATPCARPNCNTMQNPGNAEAAPAYEVMVSLSNLNNFIVAMRQSLQQAQSQWSSLQVDIQQTFWPGSSEDSAALKTFLTVMNALVGMTAAIAGGPAGEAGAALYSGISTLVSDSLTDTDKSLQYLAKMETAAAQWYDQAMGSLNTLNDDLMSVGHHTFPDGSVADVQPLLANGAWLDYRNIPVLNTDASKPRVSTQQLNALFYNLLLGQLVNWSWRQQAVYIVKYDMTQEEFDSFVSPSGSNDFRLKVYYGGSAFFFQSLYVDDPNRQPKSQNPPGWGDIEAKFNNALGSQDILRSSADAFHDTGNDHVFSMGGQPVTDPAGLLSLGPKARGFWNIPVCVPSSDMVHDLDSLSAHLDPPDQYYPDGSAALKISSWCACKDFVDGNGKLFSDLFPKKFLDAMDPNCNPVGVGDTMGGGMKKE